MRIEQRTSKENGVWVECTLEELNLFSEMTGKKIRDYDTYLNAEKTRKRRRKILHILGEGDVMYHYYTWTGEEVEA